MPNSTPLRAIVHTTVEASSPSMDRAAALAAHIDHARKNWSLSRVTSRMIGSSRALSGTAATSGAASRRASSPVAAALRMCISSPMVKACAISAARSIGPSRSSTAAKAGATTSRIHAEPLERLAPVAAEAELMPPGAVGDERRRRRVVHPILDDQQGRARRDDAGHRPDGAARMAGREGDVAAGGQGLGLLGRARPALEEHRGLHRAAHRPAHPLPRDRRPRVQQRAALRGRGPRAPAATAVHAGRARQSRSSASRLAAAMSAMGGAHYTGVPRIIAPRDDPPHAHAARNHQGVPRRGGQRPRRPRHPGRRGPRRRRRERRGQEHAGQDPLRLLPRRRGRDPPDGARRSPIRSPAGRARARHRHGVPGSGPGPRLHGGRERRALPGRPARRARPGRAGRRASRRRRSATASPSIPPPRSGGSRSASGRRWRSSSSCSPQARILDPRRAHAQPGPARGRRPPRHPRRRCERDGYAVVLIAHKLAEVLAVRRSHHGHAARPCRRLAAARRGHGGSARLAHVRGADARAGAARRRRDAAERAPILELRGVQLRAEAHGCGLTDVDLAVAPGEMVGVAGVSGNGQRELGDVILGVAACAAGSKWLGGQDATAWPVARVRAQRRGVRPRGRPRAWPPCPSSPCWKTRSSATGAATRAPAASPLDWPAARADLDARLRAPRLHGAVARRAAGDAVRRQRAARRAGARAGARAAA